MGESAISPRHLLVAILREGQGIAAQVLHDSGVRWKQVGKTVEISVTPEAEEEAITLPADFQEALQQHPEAQKGLLTVATFAYLSYTIHIFCDRICWERGAGATAEGKELGSCK